MFLPVAETSGRGRINQLNRLAICTAPSVGTIGAADGGRGLGSWVCSSPVAVVVVVVLEVVS